MTDHPDRFAVGMADADALNGKQASMMYELAQDIDREIYEGNMTRDGAAKVLRTLADLLESGRRRAT